MKKIFTFLSIVFLQYCNVHATPPPSIYPIPSYNIPVVTMAIFRESNISIQGNQLIKNINTLKDSPMKKRIMNIQVNCVGKSLGLCQATVWVYSLDGQDILGPFTVDGGDVLSVPIDDRDWGVLVDTGDDITVSVWITGDGSKKPIGAKPTINEKE